MTPIGLQRMRAKRIFFVFFILCQAIIYDASYAIRSSSGYHPTCHDVYSVCRLDPDCSSHYHHFKKACKVKNGFCQMRNRDLCRTYLAKIQRTPLFGCVCNSHHGDHCREIFAVTNRNPCVDLILKSEFSQRPKPPKISHNYHVGGGTKPDSNPDVDLSQEKIFSSTEDNMEGYRKDGNGIILTTIHYPISHESGMKPPSSSSQQPDEVIDSEQTSSELDSSLMNSQSWPRFHLHQKFSWKIESTCPSAVVKCRHDNLCRRLLQQLLRQCETIQMSSTCNRSGCMGAVQDLYQHGPHELVQRLAFCICKQTDANCVEQQRTVLPVCAEISENKNKLIPSCNQVIYECRRDLRCRPQMNSFIDACAMNSSSQGCLHSPDRCRAAVLDILGTRLRTRCTCHSGTGTDFKSHFMCLDWQRLLWLNPCVVQAQFEFHSRPTSTASKTELAKPAPSSVITAPVTTRHIWSAKNNLNEISTARPFIVKPKITTMATTKSPFYKKTTKSKNKPVTSTVATTALSNSVIFSSGYCTWARSKYPQRIKPGTKFRVFKDSKQRCSAVCSCNVDNESTCRSPSTCNKAKPCSTNSAPYHHASRTYNAERGHCICFSGTFVCTHPRRKVIIPKRGLFLYTAYSEEDRKNIRYQVDANEALEKLENIINKHTSKHKCRLLIIKEIENIIIYQAYLESEPKPGSPNAEYQTADKLVTLDGCLRPIEKLVDVINNKRTDVPYDISLSIFKISKIVNNLSSNVKTSSANCRYSNFLMTFILPSIIISKSTTYVPIIRTVR